MDGVHDLGGMEGFGAVDRASGDEVFHARWEAALVVMLAAGATAGALGNTDRFRHAIERIDPEAYLTHGYYGRWLGGLETLLVEAGVISQQELTERALSLGASRDDIIAARPKSQPDPMGPTPRADGSARALTSPPLFGIGDLVRAAADPVPGHTRLPSYARDRIGEIISHHAGWVFPDTNAHGKGEQPQHLYTVRFESSELWQQPGFSVRLDLFEPYLSAASPEET